MSILRSSSPTALAAAMAIFAVLAARPTAAQTLEGQALVSALREGGYVIVMRHAHAPRALANAADAAPGNTAHERQLDAEGQRTAKAMGEALRRLRIPIGEILSSPTFRARQTVRLLGVGQAKPMAELGEGKEGMKADNTGKRPAWLRNRAATPPAPGSNTLIVTHLPNLVGAFGDAAKGTGDGGALIVRPNGREPVVVGRIAIDEWPRLASSSPPQVGD
ncbi:MAG TPA: histidine phosphatase family protein [Gammaproteobacteria bacterium]|nr:histidine phosphatase family protein [Gammaproteobacteria bacterium]